MDISKRVNLKFLCFKLVRMSSEEININNVKNPNKVDINVLMSKVRDEQKKVNKQNLILVSGVASFVLVLGIISSL